MAKDEKKDLSLGEAIARHHERKTGEPLRLGDAVIYTGDREGMVMVATPRGDDWQAPEPDGGEPIL